MVFFFPKISCIRYVRTLCMLFRDVVYIRLLIIIIIIIIIIITVAITSVLKPAQYFPNTNTNYKQLLDEAFVISGIIRSR